MNYFGRETLIIFMILKNKLTDLNMINNKKIELRSAY